MTSEKAATTISDLPQEIISQITEFCWYAYQEETIRRLLGRPHLPQDHPDGQPHDENDPVGVGDNFVVGGDGEFVVLGSILVGGGPANHPPPQVSSLDKGNSMRDQIEYNARLAR